MIPRAKNIGDFNIPRQKHWIFRCQIPVPESGGPRMSNRTLAEFNHDLAHRIDDSPSVFMSALLGFLGHASPENAAKLEPFGIRVFGTRHHSEGFRVEFGGQVVTESASEHG